MQISFHVIGITRDRRTQEQKVALWRARQLAADREVERKFEAAVARNEALRRLRAQGVSA